MIYEFQGEHYDIDTEDPAIAKEKIYKHLGKTVAPAEGFGTQLGHATASLADTALNTLTGTLDYGAYGLARASGLSPEQATQETTSPKNVIGRGLGITESPSYQNELSRRLTGGLGQGMQAVAQPISQRTGLPQSDVEHMIGTGMMAMGPAIPKVTNAIGTGVGMVGKGLNEAAMAPVNFSKGAMQGMAYPEGSGAKSVLAPINPKEYYPPEAVKQFQNGQINLQQLEKTKTTPQHLYENKPASNWAYGMAPENAQGMKLVPTEGNLMKGIGEIVGSGIRKNPLQGAVDLAGLYSGIGPVGSIIKAVPAAASAILNKATKLDPNFVAQKAAASTVPVTKPTTPAQVAQQAAASRIQPAAPTQNITPIVSTSAPVTPTQNAAPIETTPSVVNKATELQKRLEQTKKDLESQGLEINPQFKVTESNPTIMETPKTVGSIGDVQSIINKVPKPTKEQYKAYANETKKLKEKGQERPQPFTPEERKLHTENAIKEADDFVKSHNLDKLTMANKEQIKIDAIHKQRPLTDTLTNNKYTNSLSKEELVKLKTEHYKLQKIIETTQNEAVRLSNIKKSIKGIEESRARIDAYNADPKNKKKQKQYSKWESVDILNKIKDEAAHIERNER